MGIAFFGYWDGFRLSPIEHYLRATEIDLGKLNRGIKIIDLDTSSHAKVVKCCCYGKLVRLLRGRGMEH